MNLHDLFRPIAPPARVVLLLGLFLVLVHATGGKNAMAIEEPPYHVIRTDGIFELRRYEPQLVAETVVESDLEEAGNKAFRILFRYISGENRSRTGLAMTSPVTQEPEGEKIAMTAPVSQQPAGGKIAMTAPVGQQGAGGTWVVSFTMPAGYTLETLPLPTDPAVKIRQLPARTVAAVRYSGSWSEKRYRNYLARLEGWMRENKLSAGGDAIWARYNPPFTLWFLRRNEILIPVAQ